jgi:hypothetical protein
MLRVVDGALERLRYYDYVAVFIRYLPLEDISMFSSASCSKCVLEKDREHLLKILLLSRASVGVLMVFMFEC